MSMKLPPFDVDVKEYFNWLITYENKIMKNEKEIKKLKESVKKIQDKIKELEKPEFEVGKWYKFPEHGKAILYVTDVADGYIQGFGFDYSSKWINEIKHVENSLSVEGGEKATNEEVEAALIAEAKKRGFKEGVKVRCISGIVWDIDKTEYKHEYNEIKQTFHFHNIMVFKDGQWADIINEPKVMINGCAMKQDGDIISFGCAKFTKFQLNKYMDFFKRDGKYWGVGSNRIIKSITLDSGVEITIDQLKEIVKNIK